MTTKTADFKKLEDGTIELIVKIPQQKIQKKYQQVLEDFQKITEVKGFRKGKASKSQVEKTIGKEKIYQKTVNQLLPEIYQTLIKKHQLKPVITPRAEFISAQENKDWQVKFVTCESPEIELGNYQEAIKSNLVKGKIWTPKDGQKKNEEKNRDLQKAEQIQKIIETLVQKVKIKLPQILIENEVNQKLSQLIQKTEKMGLTLEQYFSSIGQTAEKIKKGYRDEIKKRWQLELALNKIADEENITVGKEEIDQAIKNVEKEEERKRLSQQKYFLSSILRRQKTLDFLRNL